MARLVVGLGFCVLGSGVAFASEPPRACFVSMAEAATQTRAVDPANVSAQKSALGFRLEDLRRDRLLDKRWALVRSCEHPERPAVAVALEGAGDELPASPGGAAALAVKAPVVRAGARVRVVGSQANMRFETTGVAQTNGALGESVRVRLVSTGANDGTAARVVSGMVRSAELLEWEP